jgi:hypothetical protein
MRWGWRERRPTYAEPYKSCEGFLSSSLVSKGFSSGDSGIRSVLIKKKNLCLLCGEWIGSPKHGAIVEVQLTV